MESISTTDMPLDSVAVVSKIAEAQLSVNEVYNRDMYFSKGQLCFFHTEWFHDLFATIVATVLDETKEEVKKGFLLSYVPKELKGPGFAPWLLNKIDLGCCSSLLFNSQSLVSKSIKWPKLGQQNAAS